MDKKLKLLIHKVALKNNVSDTLAEIIIKAPFLFQKRKIEENGVDIKSEFYHKYIGRFYLNEKSLNKIKENAKKSKRRTSKGNN